MIKRKLGFKARKYTAKSIVLSFWFFKKLIISSYYFISNIVKEAKSREGMCPYCDSMDLIYKDKHKNFGYIARTFTCNKCNKKGRELYTMEYVKTEGAENESKNKE